MAPAMAMDFDSPLADDLSEVSFFQEEHFEASLADTVTPVEDSSPVSQTKARGCFPRRSSVTIPEATVEVPLQVNVEHHNVSVLPTIDTKSSHRVWSTGDGPAATLDTSLVLSAAEPLEMITDLCTEGSNQTHRDDDSSVGSTTYFDASDFDSSTWTRVINNASTVGLVVMALATAVTHPLLFLAGAVTALGTANAAYRGCNYFSRDDSTWCDCCGGANPASGTNETRQLAAMDKKVSQTSDSAAKDDDATAHCSTEGVDDPADDGTFVGLSIPTTVHAPPAEPVVRARNLSPKDQEAWLLRHFPPLQNTVLLQGGPLVGLSVVDFFHVFFDDDAPYSFRAFQEKRGDVDIKYGAWEPLPTVGPISLFSPWHGAFEFPRDVKHRFFQGRRLSFKAKTNSFFGPPYATTTKTQRFLIINKRLAVLENKTILHDIPFSDRFFVMERWFITAEKVDDRYVTHVKITCEASFTQSCSFEHQIKSKSTSTISDIVASWCAMAQEAIQLTERAKINRLSQKRILDDDDESECPDTSVDEPKSCLQATRDEVEVMADELFQVDTPYPVDNQEPNVLRSNRSHDEVLAPIAPLPPRNRLRLKRRTQSTK